MNKFITYISFIFLCTLCVNPTVAHAACAKVSIEILQELTLERVAFDAKLVITNGIPDQALEEIRVDVFIKDKDGNLKDSLFFVRKPELTGISGVDGTGSVGAGSRGEAHWLIIPSPGAGGQTSTGTEYWVGATLTYTIAGKQEVVPINPDRITVKPMPQLVLDYFMPYSVLGDNPFTPQVEPPVPYPLAVRVMNDGYGTAAKLKIDSAQPKIVDNQQGLLIDFKLLGASVNDSAVTPSLTVDFGDLGSKKAATASWQMISTLSGRFIEFKASFTHASELGGELTSLINATNAHYLTHMVKVNLPGRDSRLDFLADTDRDAEHLPDAIFESEIPNNGTDMANARSAVTVLYPLAQPERPTPETPAVALSLPAGTTGWVYTKLPDPSQGMLKLLDVVRGDGVHLDPHNFWVDQGLDQNYKKTWTLQFVDYRTDAATPGSYSLIFTKPDVDTTPPASSLIFDGPATGSNPAYITPQTRLLLTAIDNEGGSGVDAMFKKAAGIDSDFVPAYPFNLTEPGSHTVEFYSTDRAGNVEVAKSATVVVVAASPEITSFTATPASFAPQAPKGVAAARTVDFTLTATSSIPALAVEIGIVAGSGPQAGSVVRGLKGSAASGSPLNIAWDGKDTAGQLVPTGSYTARVKVSDGLDNPADPDANSHTAVRETTLTAADWFAAAPVDPNPAADQLHPRVSGTRVVWQDMRNGNWDIYTRDLAAGDSVKITSGAADHQFPAVAGNIIVWQDNRNGNWDIYGHDLATGTEFTVFSGEGDQERPVIAGEWMAWQDNRNGNRDIYAYNLTARESVQLTSHERDQLHPAIAGTTVAWEDYRNGLGEIYRYDLVSRTETRVTLDPENQTLPALSAAGLVWTDQRNGQKDIYIHDPARGALRITYGTGDHSQAAILNDLLVYTDYEAGIDDPNLSFRALSGGAGGRLSSNAARQEEPAIGTGYILWQDNRDGKFQIYAAPFATEALPIEAALAPGFNLVAAGGWLAGQYPSASALIAAKGEELGIERILSHDPLHNTYTEAAGTGGDFTISKGAGLVVYAQKSGTLKLAESGETATYTLLLGTNQIGILTVPFGYSAYDMMKSVGLDNIQSVRRFDTETGAWQSVAVRAGASGDELVGLNFVINPGDGLMVTMKNRVDGWIP
ncbi:MAG: hypothetical protein HYS23_10825 [Geobacter sp.]|nr:hypothetical protein [Geobacter sp.]